MHFHAASEAHSGFGMPPPRLQAENFRPEINANTVHMLTTTNQLYM